MKHWCKFQTLLWKPFLPIFSCFSFSCFFFWSIIGIRRPWLKPGEEILNKRIRTWVLGVWGADSLPLLPPECGFIPLMPLFSSKPTWNNRPGATRRNWCGLVVLWDKRLLSRHSGTFLLTSNSHLSALRSSLGAAASFPSSVLELCSYSPKRRRFLCKRTVEKSVKMTASGGWKRVRAAGRGSRRCPGEECEGPILPSAPFSRLFTPWRQELFTLHNSKRTKTGFLMQMNATSLSGV